MLCDPIFQKKVLVNKIEVVMEEATDKSIVDVSKHLEQNEINEEKSSVEEILSWVKSARRFKRSKKKGNRIKINLFT